MNKSENGERLEKKLGVPYTLVCATLYETVTALSSEDIRAYDNESKFERNLPYRRFIGNYNHDSILTENRTVRTAYLSEKIVELTTQVGNDTFLRECLIEQLHDHLSLASLSSPYYEGEVKKYESNSFVGIRTGINPFKTISAPIGAYGEEFTTKLLDVGRFLMISTINRKINNNIKQMADGVFINNTNTILHRTSRGRDMLQEVGKQNNPVHASLYEGIVTTIQSILLLMANEMNEYEALVLGCTDYIPSLKAYTYLKEIVEKHLLEKMGRIIAPAVISPISIAGRHFGKIITIDSDRSNELDFTTNFYKAAGKSIVAYNTIHKPTHSFEGCIVARPHDISIYDRNTRTCKTRNVSGEQLIAEAFLYAFESLNDLPITTTHNR